MPCSRVAEKHVTRQAALSTQACPSACCLRGPCQDNGPRAVATSPVAASRSDPGRVRRVAGAPLSSGGGLGRPGPAWAPGGPPAGSLHGDADPWRSPLHVEARPEGLGLPCQTVGFLSWGGRAEALKLTSVRSVKFQLCSRLQIAAVSQVACRQSRNLARLCHACSRRVQRTPGPALDSTRPSDI